MEPLAPIAIAKIALFQVLGLVYGVLACAVTTKLFRLKLHEDEPLGYIVYWWPHEFCELGWFLFAGILFWAALTSYFSSPFSLKRIDPVFLYGSGIALLAFLVIVPSFLAIFLGMCVIAQ